LIEVTRIRCAIKRAKAARDLPVDREDGTADVGAGRKSSAAEIIRRGDAALGRRFGLFLGGLLREPHAAVLLCPVRVDLAVPHRLERALHPNGADIDMSDHDGDE
jgi:hypothetical protein